ncbi:tetratricopeptide repeat protein [Duganella sp. FT135W]|uniref:Tetratricopeptide repeat protein n=1 Tax=Duganella flavida TaxID=2692175 RepID=A0A6L8K8C6_9BURK|nr:tetratricopeptide repeat protein [Duganella flavida]MYM23703.1 tetratricopeptide repeat protein [Duganella flavida]
MKNKTAQTMLYCALALSVSAPARADDYADVSKLAKAGKVVEALNKTNEYLGKHPSDPQMRFMKGVLLTEQNKSEEAIAIFTKLTEDYKDLPEPYNNLAVLYAANGQYDKARAALEKAIRTNPSYQTAYENLGDIYGKMASQAYDKALALGSISAVPAKSKLTMLRTFSTSTGGKIVGAETAVAQVAAPTPAPVVAPARPATSTQPPLISQLPPQNAAQANAPQRIPALSVSPPSAAAPKVATAVAAVPAAAPVAAKPLPAPAPAPAAQLPVKVAAAPVVAPAPAPAPAPVKVAVAPAPAPAPVVAPLPAKVEPPKPSKPEPEKVAAKPDTSDRDAVVAQVNGWAKAWASQNVDSYLGYYSQQFEPPKGVSRKAWADERRARIEGKGRIHVEIAGPEVKIDGNTARVSFRQTYESDRLSARSRKTLVMVKNGGKWQIKQEVSGN